MALGGFWAKFYRESFAFLEAATSVEECHGPEELWIQIWAVGRSCSGLVQDLSGDWPQGANEH